MIDRYTRPEMGEIWSDQRKIDAWLEVEKAVAEAWARRGIIPETSMPAIRQASCDINRMREIEAETDHDVIAFLRATGETVGADARYIHHGLTSSDVVDTGLGIQVTEAGLLIRRELDAVILALYDLAQQHRNTMMIGRTHGVHAEPTTFGLKALIWFDEMQRHRRRFDLALADMSVGKISGAVGTHAHVPPDVELEVCQDLGLAVAPASNQVIQRDRHAFFLSVLAGIGGTIEKISVEIRHLQRTEVREAEEPFGAGNQGSSAMPHKRNPHESERLTGLSRLLRGYAMAGFENVPLWHERDISHSSVERVIFPDACIVADYSLSLLTEILSGLKIFPDRMLKNLELTGGLIYSQRLMLELVTKGMDRQDAYKAVQRNAMDAWQNDKPFRDLVVADPQIHALLSPEEIDSLMDPADQLTHVEAVFARFEAPTDLALADDDRLAAELKT